MTDHQKQPGLQIGVICGLSTERAALGRWAQDHRIAVRISGADSARAALQAQDLIEQGARTLVSWGIAGGLSPDLQTGALVQPGYVITQDGQRVDLPNGVPTEGLLGVERIIATPDQKAEAFRRTGAVVVDLESVPVVNAATAIGIPVVITRAVSDAACRRLPAGLDDVVAPDGRPRIARVLGRMVRTPSEWPLYWQAWRDQRSALTKLQSFADAIFTALLNDDEPV